MSKTAGALVLLMGWILLSVAASGAPPETSAGNSRSNDVVSPADDPSNGAGDPTIRPAERTHAGRAIPGARPGAYTELIIALRVAGVPSDTPAELDVVYLSELLGTPRVASKDRAWSLDLGLPGRIRLQRGGSPEPLEEAIASDSEGSDRIPHCEDADEGDWVGRFGLQVLTPEKVSPEEVGLALHLRTPAAFAHDSRACVASAVFRTRGLLPVGGR